MTWSRFEKLVAFATVLTRKLTHPDACAPVCNISLETCPPKSLRTSRAEGINSPVFSRIPPPTFLFLHIHLSKNRYHETQYRTELPFRKQLQAAWLNSLVKNAQKCDFSGYSRANDVVASGAPPSLCRVYSPRTGEVSTWILPIYEVFLTISDCQHHAAVRPYFSRKNPAWFRVQAAAIPDAHWTLWQ